MVQEKLNPEELDFCLGFSYPIAISETIFSNLDNLAEFNPTKFSEIRLYQYPMLSGEPFIDIEMPGLSSKDKFNLRKNAGEIYNFGARRFGKSLISMKIDLLISLITESNTWVGFSSSDQIHLQDILDCVIRALNFHPVIKLWKQRVRASPKYEIETKDGYVLHGVNQNIASKDSGGQFFGKHFFKIFIDENSLENEASYDKRKDAVSELGCINRCSGMTNFLRFSPAGKTFNAPENQTKIINLPQYVNPNWDDEEDKKRQIEFGGKDSLNYLVFVKGEVVSDGLSEFDLTRIEPYIDKKNEVKVFEIKKETFQYFKNLIAVARPSNAERIFIAADIGDGAGGSEVIIFSEIGNKYNYLYRLSLTSLRDDEQTEIFEYLISKLQANVVALDCGDGTGRSIIRRLEKKYTNECLVRYAGTEKIGVDFKKNDNGVAVIENGVPVLVEEFMSEWSVRFLKSLLYEGRLNLKIDYKFTKQLASIVSKVVGTRTVYACVSPDGDHVFDAFKVFAIAVFLKHDFNATPKLKSVGSAAVSSWALPKKEVNSSLKEQIDQRQEIICTKDEFKSVRTFLIQQSQQADFSNNKELVQYFSKELNRLTKLFSTE